MRGIELAKEAERRVVDTKGRVHLYVRGFSAQSAVSAASIADAIQWLPGFHLAGLREIVYAPDEPIRYPSLGVARPSSSWAEYRQVARAIFVHKADHSALFWHVLYHEIGHHVYFLVLSSAIKKRWATELYSRSHCATAYGLAGVAEDFAECYSLYAQDTRSLDDFPKKLSFMREEVFSGDAHTLKEESG